MGLWGGVTVSFDQVRTTHPGSCKLVQRAQKWVRCAARWKKKAESGGSRQPRAHWECVTMELAIIAAEEVLINTFRQAAAVGDQSLFVPALSLLVMAPLRLQSTRC